MSPSHGPSFQSQSRRGFRAGLRALIARLRGGALTTARLTRSVALGLFIGCSTLYVFLFWLVLATAAPFRLAALVAYLASNISIPPMIPFLLLEEAQVGTFL